MKAYGTNSKRSGYKLAQLCRESDFHPSTVHYYMKIGLLHRPRKVGLGLYIYDDTHLKKLEEIRTLKERENLPLSKIRERLEEVGEPRHLMDIMPKGKTSPREAKGARRIRTDRQGEKTRDRVLDVATELFSKKGYEGTTINEITQTLQMSKGSFYLYFRDKKELFIECIERLANLIVPEEQWEEISSETDYTARQAKRIVSFLEAYPSYAGILNMVKIAALGEDESLALKAREAFGTIVNPILRDFRRAVAQGIVREVDEKFFAYIVLGMAENVGYKLMTDPDLDLNESVEKYIDIIARGVLPSTDTPAEEATPRHRSGEITDVTGETVKVRDIYFGGKPYLTGRIGEGEVRVDNDRIAYIMMDETDPECIVEVTMLDGEKSNLEQDGNLIISAASSVGLYTIPFRLIRSISFA